MSQHQLYGGLEAGGTKFICVVGSGPENILEQTRIDTTVPEETLGKVIRFFQPYTTTGKIAAIGIGCFGPLDLNPDSPTYGFITSTPKPRWSNTDVLGTLRRELKVKAAIDTDVNAAALGEFRWGASSGTRSFDLLHHRHWHRRRIHQGWQAIDRSAQPGDGTHPHPTRLEA